MIMESLDEYLETVATYIFDNDKVVTYKWLSKELEIHVNLAKQILWEFWQRYKEEKNFECTLLLMGTLEDGGMRVEVVKEKDLAAAKEKYSKVISEHVYSLQKILPEIQLLALTENGDVRYAAIKCLENNERSEEDIHILRWGAAMSSKIERTSRQDAQPILEQNEIKNVMSPEEKQMGKKKNADRKGFDHLFGKATSKQKTSTSSAQQTELVDSSVSTKNVPESSKKPAQKNGLDTFFQHGKSIVDGKPSNLAESKTNVSPEKRETAKKGATSGKTSKEKNNRGKKRNRSKDSAATAKRRKRITIQSDSSETGSSDEIQEIPSSPEKVSPVKKIRSPSPPQVKFQNGKRKVLKMVDKTFEEDGFLVTKKVHVYESCSEEEPEIVETKKPVTSEPQTEAKGKKSTKQTTLMTFFKKS